MRTQYQILVFPYIRTSKGYEYCLFKRKDLKVWQGIAGGGEEGETALESAKRETYEEALIPVSSKYILLRSIGSVPAKSISAFKDLGVKTIPEYSFGVEVRSKKLTIGHEHTEYGWFTYEEAINKLNWDSNKKAMTELNTKLV
ncbi:MAG: NUDIX domain-containing protein [Patescibacteria group bacterium]